MLSFADAVQVLGEARETGIPIWEVSQPGFAPSYFVGTVHTVKVDALSWRDDLLGAIGRTHTTAVERDWEPEPGFMKRVAHQVFSWGLSFLTPKAKEAPENFNEKAGEELSWAAALWIANESGGNWTPQDVHEMQDTMSVSDVLGTMSSFAMGRFADEHPDKIAEWEVGDEREFLDFVIAAEARDAGHTVIGLETEATRSADAVAAKLEKLPEVDERKAMATIRRLAMTGGELETTLEAYLAGHMRQVLRIAGAGRIVPRNRTFWGKVKPLIDAGGALIAVGIGHMTGSTGLIEQARKAGFEVRQVAAGELSAGEAA